MRRSLPATSAASRRKVTHWPPHVRSVPHGAPYPRRAPGRPRCAPLASRAGARVGARATRATPSDPPTVRRARPRRARRALARRDRRGARRAGAAADRAPSTIASATRRRCPWESRPCVTRAARSRPRRSTARSASAAPRPVARGGEPEVLPHGQVVVAKGLVTHEGERAADRPPVDREVDAEHLGVAGTQREETCTEPQERGLPGAVGARDEHDLAGLDVEIGAGERGEPTEHADGRPKVHDAQERSSGRGRDRTECTKTAGQAAKHAPKRTPRALGDTTLRNYARSLCDGRSRPSAGRW